MTLFTYEFIFFIVSIFSILVCLSSTVLFAITYRLERKLRSIWRSLGFLLLAVAFFLLILERKYLDAELIGILAVLFQTIGLFSIYRGVRAEPILSQLVYAKQSKEEVKPLKLTKEFREPRNRNLLIGILVALVVLVSVAAILTTYDLGYIISPILLIFSFVFVVATITIQVKRYNAQKEDPKMRTQNLYPLVGYIFLAFSLIAAFFYRLPEYDVVLLRKMILEYSAAWQIAIYMTFLAFAFLGIWAWNFIKIRRLLKIYVVFLAAIILVASLGALIFNYFLFNIIEKNNLEVMKRGAETKELVLQDRTNSAILIAGLMSDEQNFSGKIESGDYEALNNLTKEFLEKTNVDRIRVYSKDGEILVSPTDERDVGRVVSDDALLSYAIIEKKPIKSLNTIKGVLSDIIIARAVYPVLSGDNVIGAIEIGYVFDNAFADYIKDQTGLESTIYTGPKRSATTILTLDGVSRWVGSEETNREVLEKVLNEGGDYSTTVDRLGIEYYSAFKPLRDVNGEIIGMISVGVPTQLLIEDARQQLLSVFLLITLAAVIASGIGAFMLYIRVQRK